MRKYAFVQSPNNIQKIMIYETEQEVYLFTYQTREDESASADYWFETLEEAEDYSDELFEKIDWIRIEDPEEGSPHDLINPIGLNRKGEKNYKS